MRRLAVGILLFLTLYVPVEDFVLKWLPVPGMVYAALRQGTDLLVIIAASLAVGDRVLRTRRFRAFGGGLDLFLVLFVASALFSALFHGADYLGVALNLKALLRYILVAYALLNVNVGETRLRLFGRVFIVALSIQVFVGVIQIAGGPGVAGFFLPRTPEEAVAGQQLKFTATWEAQHGWIFGTIGHTVGFGGFLLVGLAYWLTGQTVRPARYWTGAVGFLVLAYFTGSRATTLAVILMVGFHQYMLGRFGKKLALGVFLSPLVLVAVLGLGMEFSGNYVTEAFSGDYLEQAMNQRLGIALLVIPYFLSGLGPIDILFGITPDRAILGQMVSNMFDVPIALIHQIGMIEDVYWAALLVYYGVFGVGLLLAFLIRIFHRLWQSSQVLHGMSGRWSSIAVLLLGIAFPLNMLGQFFEIRQFSFYLWLFIGLAFAYQRTLRRTSCEADGEINTTSII
jgi:hypothetical protein